MNRLTQLFKAKNQQILNIYFTAGHPKRDDTEGVIRALAAAGTDLIEVGMPYSDPLADGPTIQKSGARALENGMTLDFLFDQIQSARQHTQVPLILMGYFNQVMQFGDQRFFQKCKDAGVDGLILPDLPLALYEQKYKQLLTDLDIKISFLMTPQTPDSRIRQIDKLSTGFVYIVSSYAITGAKTGISDEQLAYFERIQSMKLKSPRLIGFGISDRATFDTACQYANGAIIGSAFIRHLENAEGGNLADSIHDFVSNVRS